MILIDSLLCWISSGGHFMHMSFMFNLLRILVPIVCCLGLILGSLRTRESGISSLSFDTITECKHWIFFFLWEIFFLLIMTERSYSLLPELSFFWTKFELPVSA